MHYNVAIVGGGPAGSTTAGFLKKYDPTCTVLVLEREKFPRDHVGESQLPQTSRILDELGVWDKVEAANFPIKLGASYRWGKNPEMWELAFVPKDRFINEPRPAKFEGQRTWTAFQVDRAVYDDILLKHAGELGAEVREECRVTKIEREGDRVTGLRLANGEKITADYYVDATGHPGVIRRSMGVEISSPTNLQNVAVWDYWQNADWAVEVGVGGTLVQVFSLGYGWFWFIPIGPSRTSIGFVTSAKYLKESGLTAEELYHKAFSDEPRIADLTHNAVSEGKFQATKDWSFIAGRMTGENWMLVGESAGFADPILAAGLSLTHASAREAAYTLLAFLGSEHDSGWLRDQYEKLQTRRINNHIRFADYWYTANAQFADLKEFTRDLAASNGLDLSPEKAWAWLAQGGFIDEEFSIGLGGFTLDQVKSIGERLSDFKPVESIGQNNVFRLNFEGAVNSDRAIYYQGEIRRSPCIVRNNRVLPVIACTDLVVHLLQQYIRKDDIVNALVEVAAQYSVNAVFTIQVLGMFETTLDAMISDGWVVAENDGSCSESQFPNRLSVLQWLADHNLPCPDNLTLK